MAQAVARSRLGGLTYLAPAGSLTDPPVQEALAEALEGCARSGRVSVVLDLERVGLISNKGLEIIVEANAALRAAGGRLAYVHASPVIRQALAASGIAPARLAPDNGPQPVHSPLQSGPQKKLQATPRQIGQILRDLGVLSESQLAAALAVQEQGGGHLGKILIAQKAVSESELLRALSTQTGLVYLELTPGLYDPQTAAVMPERTARRLKVLPMFRVHDLLILATADPMAIPDFDEIEAVTGCGLRLVLARTADIEQALDLAYSGGSLALELVDNLPTDIALVERSAPDVDVIDELASGSPVINLVNGLIQRAVRDGASDIHFECSRDRAWVRLRIDGVLYEALSIKTETHPAIVSRLKVMANLDIAERRLPQDGRIQIVTQKRSVDLRFSSLPGIFGEKVVLRVLDKNQSILEVEKVGMRAPNLEIFKRLLSRSHGLILATGPTGSGKTTMLYAAINHLKNVDTNIVTIEDPVEYQLDIINQNQINDAIGLGFAKMLRHVLRQDPDIVMVGEIRDTETAHIAVQAALTGHLVLSTLHTNDAVGAVSRMTDMGVEPYLLSSGLLGVVAQRLVRRICGGCKATFLAPPELVARHGWPRDARLGRGRGCRECYDSGYRGRIGIHEVIETTEDLQRLMLKSPSKDQLQAYARSAKLESMFDDGLHRVLEGRTTLEEVTRSVYAS